MHDDEISRIVTSDEFHKRCSQRLPHGIDLAEVLGRTWERGRKVPPENGDRVAWLVRIAQNIAKDDAKAERRRKRREQSVACRDHHDKSAYRNNPVDSPRLQAQTGRGRDGCPAAALEHRELRRAIVNAVRKARLPRDHRCALWAWVRGGLAEWAKRHKVSAATTRVWALRAREAIRPWLVRAGFGPSANWNVKESQPTQVDRHRQVVSDSRIL